MAERREGRLARWSRLKTQGQGRVEDAEGARVDVSSSDGVVPRQLPKGFEDLPDPSALPGGVQKRTFVPPMAPLADLESVDENIPAFQAPSSEALTMLNGNIDPGEAGAEELLERELTPEEQAAVDDLPPLESLSKESDFTPFLADNVPEFIRNRALRILWRSDPFFGFQDGLDDYAENFRVIDKLIDAVTQSSYRPGKGYDFPDDEDIGQDPDGERDGPETDGKNVRSDEFSPRRAETEKSLPDSSGIEESDVQTSPNLPTKDV